MALNGEEGRRRTNNESGSSEARQPARRAWSRRMSGYGFNRTLRGKASGGQGRGDGMENRDQKARSRGWRPRE